MNLTSGLEIDNNTGRKISMMIAGKIPEAGPFIAIAIGLFWPEEEVSLWDLIKDQVEELVDQKIAENNLIELERTLQGIKYELHNYEKLTDLDQKIAAMQAIDKTIELNVPRFLSNKPEENFTCFWGFALLHMIVKRENCFLVDDKANRDLLEKSIQMYSLFARVAASRMYVNRMNEVSIEVTSQNEPGKVSNWIISVELKDGKTKKALYSFHQRYLTGKWSQSLLNEQTIKSNLAIKSKWDRLHTETIATITDSVYTAILELEKAAEIDQEEGIKELAFAMGPKDYKLFMDSYFPYMSEFLYPETERKLKMAKMPIVQLNPFIKIPS